jgi:hypothetical protein
MEPKKEIIGRCEECGEMTSLKSSCCDAPIWINGALMYRAEEEEEDEEEPVPGN